VLDDADRPVGAPQSRSATARIETGAGREVASVPDSAPANGGMAGRIRRRILTFLGGIRLRMVWWFIVVLAIATAASVILVRQVLVQRLDARIEAELVQEVDEVRRLAGGNDPETGEPFGSRVDRIFEVFIERNIPARHEALLTFVDGRLHLYTPADEPEPLGEAKLPYALNEDRALATRWANIAEPDRGRAGTPAGAI
jgi:hypothetical protein